MISYLLYGTYGVYHMHTRERERLPAGASGDACGRDFLIRAIS